MSFNILSLHNFPEVTITQFLITLTKMKSWLIEMDLLLEEYQDFVLIYPLFDPLYFEKADPVELRSCRMLALSWFQDHRQILKEKCRGIILPIKEDDSNLPIVEIHREELESFYRIPTEVLYHPQDLSLLVNALIYDYWDIPSPNLHKVSHL